MFPQSQQSWLGLGTGMTEKVVGTLFAYLGCKQRIRTAGNDRIGIEPAG